jgi:hypothetical protein
MSEVSYRITESDKDGEQAQSHGGNDQSVFGKSRSSLAGPKPPDELSHGAAQVPNFPGTRCGKNRWRVMERAGNMPPV